MIDNWSAQYRVSQANRMARNGNCVFPYPCPDGWDDRKVYPHPELLSAASPLEDLKLALEGFSEETCMLAVALLAKRPETEAVQLLWNLAAGQEVVKFRPSEWMVLAAGEEMLVHPVGYPALLDSVRRGGVGGYLLGRKWGADNRLVPDAEEAFLEVLRKGLNQTWIRSERAFNDDWRGSGVDVTLTPEPQNGISFNIMEISTAFSQLGRGKTAESLRFLLDNFQGGAHEFYRNSCRLALEVRNQWDPEAADALIEERKQKDPCSIYHFCTPDEARDFECFARPGVREELNAKYDRQIYDALKAENTRATTQNAAAKREHVQRMKEQGRRFMGAELPKPMPVRGIFGEEKTKSIWAHWLDNKVFGPSGFIEKRLAFPFKSFLMFGWLGFALFVFALHTMPVLWALDRLIARTRLNNMSYLKASQEDLSWLKLRKTLDSYARQAWHRDHEIHISRNSYMSENPALAILVAISAFVLTSPFLALSVPFGLWACVSKGHLTLRLWPKRWGYPVRRRGGFGLFLR